VDQKTQQPETKISTTINYHRGTSGDPEVYLQLDDH
jgi:hypothetical protein